MGAATMPAYLSYFAALERMPWIGSRVLVDEFPAWHRPEFVQRRWIKEQGYDTHVIAPFRESRQEVEVQIDHDAAAYRYHSVQCPGRIVERPLCEIALYAMQVDAWLGDLAALIGIEQRRRSVRRLCLPGHLWHLGDVRIAGTHEFAPVFVARAWRRAPQSQARAVLEDAIWPRRGIVLRLLRDQPLPSSLPGGHAMRGLDEFVRLDDGQAVFEAGAFNRVLRGFVTPAGQTEPVQFLQGTRVKLPHFPASRTVSETRAAILKVMWGLEGKAPPAMKWAQVNAKIDCGYRSFDEAFGDKATREDYLALIRAGGHYRVRRE